MWVRQGGEAPLEESGHLLAPCYIPGPQNSGCGPRSGAGAPTRGGLRDGKAPRPMKAPSPPHDGRAHLPDGVTEAPACLPSLPLPAVPAATELQPPVHTKQMPALRWGTKVHTFCGWHRKVTTVTLSSCRTWDSGSKVPRRPQPMARHWVPWGSSWFCWGSWATATWALRVAGRSSWGRGRLVGSESPGPAATHGRLSQSASFRPLHMLFPPPGSTSGVASSREAALIPLQTCQGSVSHSPRPRDSPLQHWSLLHSFTYKALIEHQLYA